jgi:hypothetical protein
VTLGVVDALQSVHVAEEESERDTGLEPPCDRGLECARVRQAGEEVALREEAQPLDKLAVARGKPAEEAAHRRVREEAKRRREREELGRRDVRIDDDAEREERDSDRAGENPARHTAGQRECGDREIEEMGDAEPRNLEDDECREHERVARNREAQDERSVLIGRVHTLSSGE